MNRGKLYLIPNIISDNTHNDVIPLQVLKVLPGIQHFLVEDIRTARRYLSSLHIYQSIESLAFEVLDKNTKFEELQKLFHPIWNGSDVGVISEAGCPGIADPGALATKFAHLEGIQVIPLVGPSSILLALMASGLNGQRFAFHGYLPIEAKDCARVIRELEKESQQKNQTQIFIETPYRNNHLKALLLKNLNPDASLCIAADITGAHESIQTRSIKEWKSSSNELAKTPALFLFLSP
jgi:16S rRNA (cytidine1402-2'-O)-methyltransferase